MPVINHFLSIPTYLNDGLSGEYGAIMSLKFTDNPILSGVLFASARPVIYALMWRVREQFVCFYETLW